MIMSEENKPVVAYALLENEARNGVLLGPRYISPEELARQANNKEIWNRRLRIPKVALDRWDPKQFVTTMLFETGYDIELGEIVERVSKKESEGVWVLGKAMKKHGEITPRLTDLAYQPHADVFTKHVRNKSYQYYTSPKLLEWMQNRSQQL